MYDEQRSGLTVVLDESGEARDDVRRREEEGGRREKIFSVIKVNKSRMGRSKEAKLILWTWSRGGKEHSRQTQFRPLRKERTGTLHHGALPFTDHCDVR